MLPQLVRRQYLPRVAHIPFAGSAHDHQNASPRRSIARLDDEIVLAAEKALEAAQLGIALELAKDFRRGDADANTQVAHAHLVVDQGIEPARIVIENILSVASIH